VLETATAFSRLNGVFAMPGKGLCRDNLRAGAELLPRRRTTDACRAVDWTALGDVLRRATCRLSHSCAWRIACPSRRRIGNVVNAEWRESTRR